MNLLLQWLAARGLLVVFANLFIEQLGLPLPAYPVLVVMGAWSVDGRVGIAALVATAVAACLAADLVWYFAGRRWGSRVLRTVCRISISPDSCVRQTETLFARWGVWSLLVAKLIPGFGTIATALSGRVRVPLAAFIAVDIIGATIFTGLGIGLGRLFHAAIDDVLGSLASLGRIGGLVIVAGLALFIAAKWWQRWRLVRELRMARITVQELEAMMGRGDVPTIIDVRSHSTRQRDGTIPGALAWVMQADAASDPDVPEIDRDAEVVVYCACPNEVSAAKVARQLRLAGFTQVRPLHGGIDAWIAAGLPVERPAAQAA